MLTLLAVLATTFVVAGCGGKSSSTSKSSTSTTQSTTKHKSKPAY
ncbi:MAG: hypothetical protein ACYDC2_00125 [Solirubrobacteraceae bacterium]